MTESALLVKTPIKERIERYLSFRPTTKLVPVHPQDYAEAFGLYKTGAFGDNPAWELGILGKLHASEED